LIRSPYPEGRKQQVVSTSNKNGLLLGPCQALRCLGKVTSRLWEISDIVDLLEAWETTPARETA